LGRIGSRVDINKLEDCLMFARIQYELDGTSNARKEDEIVITGSQTAYKELKNGGNDRKKWWEIFLTASCLTLYRKYFH
jgi:homoserine acetyltransferase